MLRSILSSPYLFPVAMIALNLCQCVQSARLGQGWMAVYWFAAALLNTAVAAQQGKNL